MFVLATTRVNRIKKPPVFTFFIWQALFTVFVAAVFAWISGQVAGYSSLMGGAIFAIPQLYFGVVAFLESGARSVDRVIQNFYKGESAKLILIASGFGIAFSVVKPLDVFALFFSFVAVLVLNIFLPAFVDGKNTSV